ncbi:hypothetical protein H9X77_05645 [Clostridium saudiense]|nr:hypothetical protein [Clostridium saudiense]
MKYVEMNLMNKNLTLKEAVDKAYEVLQSNLIDIEKIKGGYGSFAMPRKQEILSAYNRFRKLRVKS